jgi:hypothetical protein
LGVQIDYQAVHPGKMLQKNGLSITNHSRFQRDMNLSNVFHNISKTLFELNEYVDIPCF